MKKLLFTLALLISFSSFGQTSEQYLKIGDEKQENGDNYGAIAAYTKALELTTTNLQVFVVSYNNRGKSKASLKDYYGAIADYTKAIENLTLSEG